jgi:hypothetical protein
MIVTHKARELTHKINIRQETEFPFLIWIAVVSTLIAGSFGNLVVLGYTIKGLAWYFPFVFSILILLRSSHRVSFPWYLWLPWVCIVMLYLFFSRYPNALQRSIMMLCPVVIGMAISVFPIHEANLKGFRKLCRNMVIAFYIIIILKTGIYATGTLPSVTGLAAEVMTVALLATLFAAYYAYGGRKYLLFWVGLATIPIIAMTRMGMVAAGLTLPLTFAPLNFYKRLTISFAIVVIGASLFYTERFQKRMFYSEQGSINEVRLDNPDFRTEKLKKNRGLGMVQMHRKILLFLSWAILGNRITIGSDFFLITDMWEHLSSAYAWLSKCYMHGKREESPMGKPVFFSMLERPLFCPLCSLC